MHISNSCVGFNANLIYLLPLAQCMYSQRLPEAASPLAVTFTEKLTIETVLD